MHHSDPCVWQHAKSYGSMPCSSQANPVEQLFSCAHVELFYVLPIRTVGPRCHTHESQWQQQQLTRARHAGNVTQQRCSQLSVIPPQCRQQQRQQVILVIVKNQLGAELEVLFRFEPRTKIALVKKARCDNKSPGACRFVFDGRRLEEGKIIEDYDLMTGDSIDCFLLKGRVLIVDACPSAEAKLRARHCTVQTVGLQQTHL